MANTTEGSAKRDQTFINKAEAARRALKGQYPAEWNQLPRTRKEAQLLGVQSYFNAISCKQGHISPKQTSKGVCTECHFLYRTSEEGHKAQRARHATRMSEDPSYAESNRLSAKKHYHNVMKHDAERMAKHYQAASEAAKKDRASRNAIRRAFNARNPGYGREHVAARRAQIRHTDLTPAEQAQVKAIYRLRIELSRMTGIEHHVDHHIPLSKGGKHHPDNLWVIPWNENLRKGAKLPEELAA